VHRDILSEDDFEMMRHDDEEDDETKSWPSSLSIWWRVEDVLKLMRLSPIEHGFRSVSLFFAERIERAGNRHFAVTPWTVEDVSKALTVRFR
jgi:hypothetical protein